MAKKPPDGELNDRQILFCQEYIKDFNATRAAKDAGYSVKSANAIGTENLAKPSIQALISQMVKERKEEVKVEAKMVLKELLNVASSDIREALNDQGSVMNLKNASERVGKSISSIEFDKFGMVKKIGLWDKTKSLDLLGKHLGLFEDKVAHTHSFTELSDEELELKIKKAEAARNDKKA